MSSILDQILANKRIEVERNKRELPLERLEESILSADAPRDFHAAVSRRRERPNLIAEIKAASPSAGVICADFDPAETAAVYERAGAHALSVLTDEKFFHGKPAYIERVKRRVALPVLRKDFLIDPYQIHESRAIGADAVLIIVEAVEPHALRDMLNTALDLKMTVLLEVYERESLKRAVPLLDETMRASVLIGVNNRDLKTQKIDIGNTERLAELIPPGFALVSESGVKTKDDVQRLARAGARALLIGETLMRAADPATKIRELFDLKTEPRP